VPVLVLGWFADGSFFFPVGVKFSAFAGFVSPLYRFRITFGILEPSMMLFSFCPKL
jgi:hypothetical protein